MAIPGQCGQVYSGGPDIRGVKVLFRGSRRAETASLNQNWLKSLKCTPSDAHIGVHLFGGVCLGEGLSSPDTLQLDVAVGQNPTGITDAAVAQAARDAQEPAKERRVTNSRGTAAAAAQHSRTLTDPVQTV